MSRHKLVAVAVVGADDSQLVEDVPDQSAGAPHVRVPQQRPSVERTRLLHTHVGAETGLTEGVGAGGVHGVHQRLPAHSAQQVLVYVVWIVVEVVPAGLVSLSASLAHDYVAHAPDLEAARLLEAGSPAGLEERSLCRRHL